MSDDGGSGPSVLGDALDVTTLGTGVVGGIAIPFVQFALWQLVANGPLTGPGGDQLQAEMALFVAIGVVVPAGGIALLYEDARVSGLVGAVVYPATTLFLGGVLPLPGWFFQGIAWAFVVLAVVGVLEAAAGGDGVPAETAE